jgi:hypothetical protein
VFEDALQSSGVDVKGRLHLPVRLEMPIH